MAATITGSGGYGLISASTVQSSTSGTTITFSGIPAGVKRITVCIMGVSTTGSSSLCVQLGSSGGFVTSGYQGSSNDGGTPSSYTNGFAFSPGVAGTLTFAGTMTICNGTSNTWVESHVIGGANNNYLGYGGGQVALSGTLTQVRLTTNGGTDTFDAGSVNILYE